MNFTIQLFGEINDPQALFEAALKHAIADEMTEADAREMLTDDEGEPDLSACITQLLDPGTSPAGLQIDGSDCALDASTYPDIE